MSSLALTGCGGGGGDGGSPGAGVNPPPSPPPPPSGGNETVEEVLESFGIDTAASPRVDSDGNDLPEDFAPLGSTRTINKFSEVLAFGAGVTRSPTQGTMSIINITAEANNQFSSVVLHDEPLASTPWFDDTDMPRTAAAADVDGDGREEIVIVYQEANEPVNMVVMQDESEGFSVSSPMLIDLAIRDQLFAVPGDFNGDSKIDVVIGMVSYGREPSLVMLENVQGMLTLNGQQLTLPTTGGMETHLAMSAGSVDYDVAVELAVVVNDVDGEISEGQNGAGNKSEGRSTYFVFDDAGEGFTVLRSGPVQIYDGSATTSVVVADIALGDVDGDSVDEVILGGLDEMGRGDSLDGNEPDYLLEILDDAERGFGHLAGDRRASGAGVLKPNQSGASHWLMYLHVVAADVDGDGAKEIVSNQYVYEDLRDAPTALVSYDDGNGPVEIPAEQFINNGGQGSAGSYFFSWATSDLTAGDVTSDKRENVVIFSEAQGEILVWGDDQIDGWKEIVEQDVVSGSSNYRAVMLTPDVELDSDSMALEYSSGSHRYVLTEPVIIAALAAAPCSDSLGQDLDSCRTAFGQAVSEGSVRTDGWSLNVGSSVGFGGSVPFVGSAEAVLNTQTTVRKYTNNAYTVTKTILRETGPIEDSVIFYTIPMDVYTYEVLSHPNPDLIGRDIEIRLPREPLTVMTPREVYNANVQEGTFKIDERVFQHTEGDHRSYPSGSAKNQLLSRFDGLESDNFDVSSGGGRTTVTITEFESTTRGRSFEFEASLDVKTTAGGVIAGFKVGAGKDSAVEITRGQENIYQGTVGHMDVAHFPEEVYSVGLFAYIYDEAPETQVFEVLNYWVD
jgi:hypothetical protein